MFPRAALNRTQHGSGRIMRPIMEFRHVRIINVVAFYGFLNLSSLMAPMGSVGSVGLGSIQIKGRDS